MFCAIVHSSVAVVTAGDPCPPVHKAKVRVPDPSTLEFAVLKFATSVHDIPSQSSVLAVFGGPPPKTNMDDVDPPEEPANSFRASLKSPTSVQLEPSKVSVISVSPPGGPSPPATIAAVVIPPPVNCFLAVFKSPVSVQAVPFHVSVTA